MLTEQPPTRLAPLSRDRAIEIAKMMRQAEDDPAKGLAIDPEGRVTAVVATDEQDQPAILGDFDVHA
ncbi:MAG: hypothetical protein AAF916_13205 [Planctomycetota bacterium]